jgi:hypothetical protein
MSCCATASIAVVDIMVQSDVNCQVVAMFSAQSSVPLSKSPPVQLVPTFTCGDRARIAATAAPANIPCLRISCRSIVDSFLFQATVMATFPCHSFFLPPARADNVPCSSHCLIHIGLFIARCLSYCLPHDYFWASPLQPRFYSALSVPDPQIYCATPSSLIVAQCILVRSIQDRNTNMTGIGG